VLRERAVAMLEAGNSQRTIAAALGVHKNTVCRWLQGWRVAGAAALKAKKRGRRVEAKRLLDADQASKVQRLMTAHTSVVHGSVVIHAPSRWRGRPRLLSCPAAAHG
jgi:transposase